MLGSVDDSTPSQRASPAREECRRVFVQTFGFNQDGSCFIAGTTAGFRVYTCSPLSEFARREVQLLESQWPYGHVLHAAMLYRSCCFAFVTKDEPRKVQVWDDKKCTFVGSIWCRQPIQNVLLGRDVICVVAETAVYVYQAGSVTPLSVIVTGPNPKGLCALSEGTHVWCLSCPTTTPGVIRIQTASSPDANTGTLISAHKSPIECIALSFCGNIVATASAVGTIVRLFRTSDGSKLYELRLGSIPHQVRCIAFRTDSRFVAVSSNSTTIHIFKLVDNNDDDDIQNAFASVCGATTPTLSPRSNSSCSNTTGAKQGSGRFTSSPFNDNGSVTIKKNNNNHYGTASASSDSLSYDGLPMAPSTTVSHNCNHDASTHNGVRCFQKNSGNSLIAFKSLTFPGKEWMHGTLKSVLPSYFEPQRSFAQFHLPASPDGELDVRLPPSEDLHNKNHNSSSFIFYERYKFHGISGPLCAFAGWQSNHFYVIHHDGFFYEARFDAHHSGPCQLLSVSPWFAPRQDFIVDNTHNAVTPSGILHEPSLLDHLIVDNSNAQPKPLDVDTTHSKTSSHWDTKESKHEEEGDENVDDSDSSSSSSTSEFVTEAHWQIC